MVKTKKGFTLAEVLITLVVLGVIAAMTIPNIIAHYKEQATVSGLKKAYTTIKQAYELAKLDYGTMDNWGLSETRFDTASATVIGDILSKYLNVAKTCGLQTGEGCFSKTFLLNGTPRDCSFDDDATHYKFVLNDGTMFAIRNEGCTSTANGYENKPACAAVHVDISGFSGLNTVGKDTFAFIITKDEVIPYGINATSSNTNLKLSSCVLSGSGWGCAAWVLYKENTDYLKGKTVSW